MTNTKKRPTSVEEACEMTGHEISDAYPFSEPKTDLEKAKANE